MRIPDRPEAKYPLRADVILGRITLVQRSGAALLMECLIDQEVEFVFGYPGGAVLPIYDELFGDERIRHILVRHATEPAPASIAPELEGAAAGAYEPGTATDPDAAICDATLMGPFLGREADDATRAEILQIAVNARDVRFVAPSPTYIKPDPTSARLNLMLDANNIIRDARCG